MTETQTNVLINRIVAHEAGAEDFRAFESCAQEQPQAWEQLARALRDEVDMRAALHAEDHAARAEAEVAMAVIRRSSSAEAQRSHGSRAPGFSFRAWSGWAAAALVAIAWTVFAFSPAPSTSAPETSAPNMQLASFTADDAFERYLELGHNEGRIIGELPARMIETQLADDGGLVVYYIRQLLEREHVSEVYRYAEDELGRPLPVPIDLSSISMTDSSL